MIENVLAVISLVVTIFSLIILTFRFEKNSKHVQLIGLLMFDFGITVLMIITTIKILNL